MKKGVDILIPCLYNNHCSELLGTTRNAEVAELADALDSKSSVVTLRAGSSPAFGTSKYAVHRKMNRFFVFIAKWFDSHINPYESFSKIFRKSIYRFY